MEDDLVLINKAVCEDGDFNTVGTFKSLDTLPFRVLQTPFLFLLIISTDLKVRGNNKEE